jgi:hypothetical protein
MLAAASVLALSAGSANAAILKIVDNPGAGSIPRGSAPNELLSLFGEDSLDGFYGGQLSLQNLVPANTVTLLYEFFGYEAGFNNRFFIEGTERFSTPDTIKKAVDLNTPLAIYETGEILAEGLLDFGFGIDSDIESLFNDVEGDNPDDHAGNAGGPNYFLTFLDDETLTGTKAYIFLDDDGASNDDNHDDFLIRVSVVDRGPRGIPEPGTLALIGSGLVALGLAARRRFAAPN